MNKKALAVFASAVFVAVVIIAIVASSSGPSTSPLIKSMKALANSFPAPSSVQVAFPDNAVTTPPSYTKGWRSSEKIDAACNSWRELYRNWIGSENLGKVTGNDIAGQSCSFEGPKSGLRATLQLAAYGTDPQPQITLTVTKP